MRRLFLAVAGILLSLFCGPQFALAAVMTPESITLEVLPGNRVHQTITLENDSDAIEVYTLEITGVEFGSSADDLSFAQLSNDEQGWFSLSAGSVKLDPGQSQSIEVEIAAPSTAAPQLLPVAVIATKSADTGTGVGVTSALASLLFVQIGQSLQANLAVDSFATVPENTHVSPVRFAALVSNTGAGLSQPEVGVSITNIWGHEVAVVPLNPTGRRVPGYTNRVFSAAWQAGDWRIGPYTATIYVYPDDTATVITASTRVVLFPWQMLCVFAGITVSLMAGGVLITRARRR